MYGGFVHQAVIENNDRESGISIHYVNEYYDEGTIIYQGRVRVLRSDSPEDVAKKVQNLEYEHFPRIIEKIVMENE